MLHANLLPPLLGCRVQVLGHSLVVVPRACVVVRPRTRLLQAEFIPKLLQVQTISCSEFHDLTF